MEAAATVSGVHVRHHLHHVEVGPAIPRPVPVRWTSKDMRKFVGGRSDRRLLRSKANRS